MAHPIRYFRRWRSLILATALLGACMVFLYASHEQRYVATAIVEYTPEPAALDAENGMNPEDIFSAARIDELARTLGLTASVQELRGGFAMEPLMMGAEGTWLSAGSAAIQKVLNEENLDIEPSAYRITYSSKDPGGCAYAGEVLQTLLCGYAAWLGETRVTLEPAVLPGDVQDVSAETGEYIDCIDRLIAAAQESMTALELRAQEYPAFRSAKTGCAPEDLAAYYGYLLKERLMPLRFEILAGGLARHSERLLARWRLEAAEHRADMESAQALAEETKALLEQLVELRAPQADVRLLETAEMQTHEPAQDVYGALMERYAQALTDAADAQTQTRTCEEQIARFSSGEIDAARAQDVQIGLAAAVEELGELHMLALETDRELRMRLAADSLTLRAGVYARKTVNVWLYTMLGAVLFAALGAALAVLAGRLSELRDGV